MAYSGNPELRCTELGNAEKFLQEHHQDVRFVHAWKSWLVWDGTRFRRDTDKHVSQLARDVVTSLGSAALAAKSESDRAALRSWWAKSEQAASISAMLSLAGDTDDDVKVSVEELDTDPWLLNCRNGTVDLKTGRLRPHRRRDLLTKCVSVAYDESAACPTWLSFLDRIFEGDASLIEFVRRVVGYSLTGSTREQVMMLLYGSGANGKSTFLNVLDELLEEYAVSIPSDVLMSRREPNGTSQHLARMRGARLVTAIETEEGKRLAESTVKQLTGEDEVVARYLYAEPFAFRPVAKIWMATNHRPRIVGDSHAIWRRLILVPFTATISNAERDPELPKKLRSELPGILAWAVKGALDWQESGLCVPDVVARETAAYRSSQDVVGTFLRESVIEDPKGGVYTADLYAVFKTWATDNGEHVLSQRQLAQRLLDKGYESRLQGPSRRSAWKGLRLSSSVSPL